ncbi:carbohydrate kinase [Solimonas sp. K1W22B-7]|uniref:carbohydrate kinase family protein n=1 Tax=Solimonas sp. K1W22B-7 TaxID=2303331 RepID=UPI000E32E1FD|nr:carbohydrate kinase [Solimonas sp. K1W22B-7]AXQ29401.1 carbohydrate kinase [Solimonas sp. K1W22B-7]
MSIADASLPRVVVFGEALTDFVRTGEHSWHSAAGGACWNVARVTGTLGVATGWAGSVSSDFFGHEIVDKSRAARLDMRFLQQVQRPPLIAMVYQPNPPLYFFLGNDAADLAFDEQQLPEGWRDACEIAHFGCISMVRQPLGERLLRIAGELHARGVKISYDPNYRNLMGPDFPVLFERMARLASIIKLSDEDLVQIYPGEAPEAALARVRGFAPAALILYTRGASGILLHATDGIVEQPAFSVTVADTVGAGDACIGGFIGSLLGDPGQPLSHHLRFAAATAAVVCMHPGAYAPARAEVDRLLSH